MLRLGYRSKLLLAVLCVLVVAMRVSGAHLHLCLDGSEPPASVHFDNDGGLHHLNSDRSATTAHSDVDVNLLSDALFKLSNLSLDLLDLFGALAVVLCLLAFSKQIVFLFESFIPVETACAYLRPPLRGPPR